VSEEFCAFGCFGVLLMATGQGLMESICEGKALALVEIYNLEERALKTAQTEGRANVNDEAPVGNFKRKYLTENYFDLKSDYYPAEEMVCEEME
jgi:hypothetical protein